MPDKRSICRIKNSDGSYSIRWFQTMADIVLFNDGSNVETFKSETNLSLKKKAETVIYTVNVPASWMGGEAPYTQTISVSGIKSTDNPLVDIVLNNDNETAIKELEEYAKIGRIQTSDGSITITCLEEKPEVALNIQLKVVR